MSNPVNHNLGNHHPGNRNSINRSAFQLKSWQFWVPLLLQSILIVAVPFQSAVVYGTGRAITITTAPIDPYDILRGYSQRLNYEISDPQFLALLPGGRDVFTDESRTQTFSVYVVLQAPEAATTPPSAWKPIQVSRDRPQGLPADQVALKGRYAQRRIKYGLERFYMPEKQRDGINTHIREIQQADEQTFVVDIKVDGSGRSVPDSLWVGDRNYQF